ncbi:MAG: hypothetical protein ACRD9R_17695 [Pyrinomonadaceae bacterium]
MTLKFSSPTVERTMTLLSQSIVGGILIPLTLLILVFITDPGGSVSQLSLLERHPFAWTIGWPHLLGRMIFHSGDVQAIFVAASNGIIWSLLTYAFVRWHEGLRKLR